MKRPVWRVAALLAFCMPASCFITQPAWADSGRARPRHVLTPITILTLAELHKHRQETHRRLESHSTILQKLVSNDPNDPQVEIAAETIQRITALLDGLDTHIKAISLGRR